MLLAVEVLTATMAALSNWLIGYCNEFIDMMNSFSNA
jgi:hypothetical protein